MIKVSVLFLMRICLHIASIRIIITILLLSLIQKTMEIRDKNYELKLKLLIIKF